MVRKADIGKDEVMFSGLRLQTRALLGIIGIVVLLGLAVILVARPALEQKLSSTLQKRGLSVAYDIASHSIDSILTEQHFELEMRLRDLRNSEDGLVYVFVLDSNGTVIAHTLETNLSPELINVNKVSPGEQYSFRRIATEKGEIIDISVPLLKGAAGFVRLGLSSEQINKDIDAVIKTVIWLLTTVLFFGAGMGIMLIRTITGPIMKLTELAKKVSRGDLQQRASVKSADEIGQLAATFNSMIESRKIAEEGLREAELKYRILFQQSPDGIIIVSSEGKILDFNEAACRQYGYSKEEFALLQITDLYPVGRSDEVHARICRIMNEGTSEFKVRHRTKTGELRDIQVISRPIVMAGQTVLHSILRDITEQKRAEELLLRSEEKFRSLFEYANDAIFIVSPVGVLLDINRAAYERLGYKKEEMLKMHISKFDPPEFASMVPDHLRKLMATGHAIFESAHLKKDGSIIDVEINARIINFEGGPAIFSIVRDITERKQYEHRLEELNARLKTLIQTIPDMVVFKDTAGKHIIVNKAVEEISGMTQEEMIGKTEAEVFPPDLAAECRRSDEEVFKSGTQLRFEESLTGVEGKKRYFDTIKAPIYDSVERLSGLVAISRDITVRKHAEEKVRRLNIELSRQLSRLEAAYRDMESFSYSASHDLKQPLLIIDWSCRKLRSSFDRLNKEDQEALMIIEQNIKLMEQLIDDLLAFSRVSTKKIKTSEIYVRGMIEQVCNELKAYIGQRDVRIKIKRTPDVYGDSSMMHVLFRNLISNALKFSRTKKIARIEIGGDLNGKEIVYYVRDNGVGFDMVHADMLFGLFSRLHSSADFEGNGVGLGIAKRIAEKHGGRIWAEGKPNKGATFYFSLPGGNR